MAAEVPQMERMEQKEPLFQLLGISEGFWGAFKDKIWLFEAVTEKKVPEKGQEKVKIEVALGTGVCVHPRGLILSASHCFPVDCNKIHGRTFGKSFREDFTVLYRKWDLVLLAVGYLEKEKLPDFDFDVSLGAIKSEDSFSKKKSEDPEYSELNSFEYIELASRGELNFGLPVAAIAHGNHLNYSICLGSIQSLCPPCDYEPGVDVDVYYRSVFDMLGAFGTRDDTNLLTCDEDSELVTLIQIACHMGKGSSGAAVVDQFGRLVGINVAGDTGCQFAVHIGFVRKFYEYFVADYYKGKEEEDRKKKQLEEIRKKCEDRMWWQPRN